MPVPGLTIIGEAINDSIPSTRRLFDAGDMEGLLELARTQDAGGAAYIDVNVGTRPPALMAELVRKIQSVTARPLSIDTPDAEIARAGLAVYDPGRAGAQEPILNSVSPLRADRFELYRVRPLRPILLVSEQVAEGRARPCQTAEETLAAALSLVGELRRRVPGIRNDQVIIDPGIAPLGSDSQGNLHRLMGALELIRRQPDLAGVHVSVGLSNFTVMLPSKRADGSPVKGPLENAFLTKAMPLGLDMVIGSVKRQYELLPPEHPAMVCLEDCLRLRGFDVLLRVRQFYR